MKRFTFLSFLIVLFSCSSNSQTYSNLKPKDFKAEIEQNAGIILDVRTPNEVSTGQIENASTIDFYDKNFKDKIAKIQKDKTVYVYCKSGGRSSKAAKLLVEAGQSKVINLQGGIMAWKRAGYVLTSFDNTQDSNIQEFSISDFNTVLSENNIVLVDFHTLWCAPCRKMAPMIDALEKDYESKVSISRVDLDKSGELACTSINISYIDVFIFNVVYNLIVKRCILIWTKRNIDISPPNRVCCQVVLNNKSIFRRTTSKFTSIYGNSTKTSWFRLL
jgi:rhodanese-related sulfurtransferase